MLIVYLLFLSICMGIILLSIHNQDEIHQLVAGLSGMIALICIFILTPPLIKGFLGLFVLTIGHKFFVAYHGFR